MTFNSRSLIGLSVGSGCEGVDVALLRIDGVGLTMTPRVVKSLRLAFPSDVRDALHNKAPTRGVGDALAGAVRKITAGLESRELFVVGLLAPSSGAFATAAEAVADQTGLTVVSSFAARDLAAGGNGSPLTPVSDYLLARDDAEDRLFIHLGRVSSVLLIPAKAKTVDLQAFDTGPGNRLLDAIMVRCTREKDRCDAGGTRAVQGRVCDELLQQWSRSLYFQRKPPKILRGEFDDAFADLAIDDAKQRTLGLNDLLCTATHFIARSLALGVRQWLPSAARSVYLSGGGTRNGFLQQLLAQQFSGERLRRTDDVGIPTLARKASAAGILAALAFDGVTGNLPLLTGASGGRLIGRLTPGDPRNWARAAAWAAEQMWDYTQIDRAA